MDLVVSPTDGGLHRYLWRQDLALRRGAQRHCAEATRGRRHQPDRLLADPADILSGRPAGRARRPKPSPARPSTGRTAGATLPITPITTASSGFPLPPAMRTCGVTTTSTTSSSSWARMTTRWCPAPAARSSCMSQARDMDPRRVARRCRTRICWNSSGLPVLKHGFAFGDRVGQEWDRIQANENWWRGQQPQTSLRSNSPLCRELTGNFSRTWALDPVCGAQRGEITVLYAKFPMQRNREFTWLIRE